MIIDIDDRYRLKRDKHCWHIQEASKDGSKWTSFKYARTVQHALEILANLELREADGDLEETVKKLQQKYDHVVLKINQINEPMKSRS